LRGCRNSWCGVWHPRSGVGLGAAPFCVICEFVVAAKPGYLEPPRVLRACRAIRSGYFRRVCSGSAMGRAPTLHFATGSAFVEPMAKCRAGTGPRSSPDGNGGSSPGGGLPCCKSAAGCTAGAHPSSRPSGDCGSRPRGEAAGAPPPPPKQIWRQARKHTRLRIAERALGTPAWGQWLASAAVVPPPLFN
jgi:hypothetical protein